MPWIVCNYCSRGLSDLTIYNHYHISKKFSAFFVLFYCLAQFQFSSFFFGIHFKHSYIFLTTTATDLFSNSQFAGIQFEDFIIIIIFCHLREQIVARRLPPRVNKRERFKRESYWSYGWCEPRSEWLSSTVVADDQWMATDNAIRLRWRVAWSNLITLRLSASGFRLIIAERYKDLDHHFSSPPIHHV